MSIEKFNTVLEPRPLPTFVETKFVKKVIEKALTYIAAGFPVHFRGISGTGKTTMAMHLASKIGRSVVLIHGDEEFSTSSLIGSENGYSVKKVIDNFIHTVLKTEESMQKRWVDNRLTVACKHGFTLIYDEFTRSRPEANNVLLSVLQEKMLDLPVSSGGGEGYLKVSPDFTAIFTSNPEEYAGVYRTQDALRDRMVTIDLNNFDEETEIAITKSKSDLIDDEVKKIISIVKGLRESGVCEFAPTIRGCIMIARTLKAMNGKANSKSKIFKDICMDILASETTRVGSSANIRVEKVINDLITKHCG